MFKYKPKYVKIDNETPKIASIVVHAVLVSDVNDEIVKEKLHET